MNTLDQRQGRLMKAGAFASVTVAVILIAAKTWAVLATGSVSLLGSLADSALDLIASVVTLIAIVASLIPPDEEHRFGHGKAEAIAGLFQTSVIFGSSVFLTWRAVSRVLEPAEIEQGMAGIVVSVFAMVLTLALVIFQKRVIRETGSVAISADRLHYVGDFMVNGAVIVALVLATQFGILIADGVFGLGIALYIAFNAWQIAKNSIDILMDREFPTEEREKIFNLVMGSPHVKGLHELKTRRSGLTSFIQMHISLDPDLPLKEAHAIADEVEATVGEAFPNAEIIIHTDPLGLEPGETADELERGS